MGRSGKHVTWKSQQHTSLDLFPSIKFNIANHFFTQTKQCDHNHSKLAFVLPKLQVGDDGCDRSESQGVLASELSQRLNHLLIERQEDQIAELESEPHLAQSKFHEKEAELWALKDTVRRLSQISISTLSDDETDAGSDQKGSSVKGSNSGDCESKQSVAGIKRPIDSVAEMTPNTVGYVVEAEITDSLS